GLDADEGWAGNQIVGLEQPIDGRFRDKITFCIGEAGGQLAWRQLRHLQRHGEDALAYSIGDAVPDAIWPRRLIFERLRSAGTIPVVPAVERRWADAQYLQGSSGRQMRLLDQADDLELLGAGAARRVRRRGVSCFVSP